MIRLGSLGGYPFEGPRVLGGWNAPSTPGIFAILTKPDPDSQKFEVIYLGHADDLATAGLPFSHEHSQKWVTRAGDKWNLWIATYEIPGGLPSHRERITEELIAIYHPSCNPDQFDRSWRDEWIGSYDAPTTKPLTTERRPPETNPPQSGS
ncbi:MAG: hypothetical protein ACR2N2_07680 [Acidimicrobiia bacterium]